MSLRILLSLFVALPIQLRAYDCSTVASLPSPSGKMKAIVTVGNASTAIFCQQQLTIPWFDVRHREEDAYYCLKSAPEEVLTCSTILKNSPATITVVPVSWVRSMNARDVREYRFHAYINKDNNPELYYDIFSRTLSNQLGTQNITIEGAYRTIPENNEDDFWIRVEFDEAAK